jgi:hypothetical protein
MNPTRPKVRAPRRSPMLGRTYQPSIADGSVSELGLSSLEQHAPQNTDPTNSDAFDGIDKYAAQLELDEIAADLGMDSQSNVISL